VRRRSGLGGLRLFCFWGVPDEAGELRTEEVDLALKAANVVAHAIEGIAATVPNDYESDCQNGDQKEFHTIAVNYRGCEIGEIVWFVTVVPVLGN
jgi:hypothetical protein